MRTTARPWLHRRALAAALLMAALACGATPPSGATGPAEAGASQSQAADAATSAAPAAHAPDTVPHPPVPAKALPGAEPAATSGGAQAKTATVPVESPTTAAAAAAAPAATPQAPAAPADLWERIRRGFAMPDLETALATRQTRWYANQPDYMARMSTRASLYLFHIVEEIERRGLPMELALLPFVESAMQPEAVSHAKAAGLWQFIPSTGKIYALEQNLWKDERHDVIESTRAALDYLEKLYADFGHWHLALAAYNMGEGGLARAIERNRRAKRPTDYSSLRIPNETQNYVPKLQAVKNIVAAPERYGIELPPIRDEPYFSVVAKHRDIDVATAARLAELSIEEFRALNPAFNRPLIPAFEGSGRILLPADRVETYLANLAAWEATGQPLASWTTHTLAPGETLAQVAQRAGITESQLREANRILPKFRPAPGSLLLVPREDGEPDIAADAVNASFQLVPERAGLRQITVRVRPGDTLARIAARHRVSEDDIVAWNRLRSRSLFAGQRLSIAVEPRPAAAPARKPVAKAPSGERLQRTAATR